MAGKDIPPSIAARPAGEMPFPWGAIREINERCLELLAHAARDPHSSLIPSASLREHLRQTTPETRKRAAARPYLLVELEFRNVEWWEAVRRFPEKPLRASARRITVPRRTAIQLTRATLITAREAVRGDLETARIVLGIESRVAKLISDLPITEIDRIAEQQFRHIEPRWTEYPAIWNSMLLSAASPLSKACKANDAHVLQLLTGNLLRSTDGPA